MTNNYKQNLMVLKDLISNPINMSTSIQYKQLLEYEKYIKDLIRKELRTHKTKNRAIKFIKEEINEAKQFLATNKAKDDKTTNELFNWLEYLINMKSQLENIKPKQAERKKKKKIAEKKLKPSEEITLELKQELKQLKKRSSDIINDLQKIKQDAKKKKITKERKNQLITDINELKAEKKDILQRIKEIKKDLEKHLFKMRVFTFKKKNKDKYETLKTSQKSSCLKRHGTFIFNMIDENGNMERKTEYILYYQIQYNDIHITVKAFNDIKDFEGKRTYRENPNNNNVMQDNKRFNDLLKPILNTEGIMDTKHAHIINEYADLIIAYDITRIEYEPIEDMAEEEINNSYNNNQIMFKYIEYQLNENANGFKDLFYSLDQNKIMKSLTVAF